MPIGPKGEKRPTNPVESGIMVMRIATGDIEEEYADEPRAKPPTPNPNKAKGGKKGGKARAETLMPEQRSEIASRAAKARWESERRDSAAA